MKNFKSIPAFDTHVEEAAFWDKHDSSEYINWESSTKVSFPNLKFTTQSISLRLPLPLLAQLKMLANEKDVPYQSLMKIFLSERVDSERKAAVQKIK